MMRPGCAPRAMRYDEGMDKTAEQLAIMQSLLEACAATPDLHHQMYADPAAPRPDPDRWPCRDGSVRRLPDGSLVWPCANGERVWNPDPGAVTLWDREPMAQAAWLVHAALYGPQGTLVSVPRVNWRGTWRWINTSIGNTCPTEAAVAWDRQEDCIRHKEEVATWHAILRTILEEEAAPSPPAPDTARPARRPRRQP